MGSVPVNNNGGGTGDRGLAELNYHRRYEHKEVRDGVVGEGQDLSEEDESRINAVVQDVNEGRERSAFQAQPSLQQPQQPQGSVVQWERFLPLRTLKVLLVESDDSTRHVVSALLRNCSYEVTAVSNGMQAWKILQDLTNCIDIVLTEVIMPALSGIGLLCKIMNHKTCKNIPVIMMSSHDSMGIVFKCLSKGAVDFLVKPIRKNELKNLWQHVWRRCHSSSGSGSESGIQQKFPKSKGVEESNNNTGSNDMDDNVRDGSDNGSGTQSSWTKRAVEVDSPQPTVQWDQLVNHTDSTCAQVIHPKSETFGNERMAVDAKKECPERDEKLLDNIATSKDLEIGVPISKQHEDGSEKVCTNMPELRESEQLDKGLQEHNSNKPTIELRAQFINFAGLTTNCSDPQADAVAYEAPNGFCKPSEIEDKTSDDPKEPVSLELSLERMRGVVADVGSSTPDERNILRHSDMSAFSRYNTASTANQAPAVIVGSCSPHDNSSEAMKTESMHNQQSNESSDNNDMGSTTKNLFAKPAAFNEKSTSMSTARYVHSSAFRPVQSGRICSPVQIMPQKVDDVAGNASGAQPRDAHQQVQVQHHHHHYHHHHHHVHGMQQQQQQQQQTPDQDDLSLNITTSTMQCVSSDVFGGPIEGNGGNYSLNGSASCSNNGSNRQNGSGKDLNVGGTNSENDVGVTRKNIVGASGSGSSTGSGVDQNQFSQRVAALTKFRQKRKERCFEKKVRYQSRKMLAEQRPRVRGQFVRQRLYENNDREANS